MSVSRLQSLLKENRPLIMGVLNVTPDSFSEKGTNLAPQKAIQAAREMLEKGADVIDIGGESTRPGASPVKVEEELARVMPVIENLADEDIILSIDTRNSETMRRASEAGAALINDVTALADDPHSLKAAAESNAMICLMHMQGRPQTMQNNPAYNDVVRDVIDYLKGRIEACAQEGIDSSRIIVDPGIGFGKTLEHNLTLFKNLDKFRELNVPLLLGASRKSFIEKICGSTPPDQRLPGSLAACLWGYQKGVKIFRVHDVAETAQALEVWKSFSGARPLS